MFGTLIVLVSANSKTHKMKKQLFTLALLFAGLVANAQISKGDIQLNGSLILWDQTRDGAEFNHLNISPSAGFLLSDNISLGVTVGFRSDDYYRLGQLTGTEFKQEISEFNYGVFARFYKNPTDNFYLFLQPSISLTSGKKLDFEGDTYDTNGFKASITAGMTYFISPKFAVELSAGNIGYTSTTYDNAGTETKDTFFSAYLDFSDVGFGLSYFIR
jgi:Outer membrane protein beta-barrel domain